MTGEPTGTPPHRDPAEGRAASAGVTGGPDAQTLAKDALKQLAEQHGVCVRPLALRRTDTTTGLREVVEVPCGATLAAKCKPCAERSRRLRIQQIREGWHLTDEPTIRPDKPGEDVLALVRVRAHLEFEREAIQYQPMTPDERATHLAEIDAAIAELDEALGETSLRGHLTPKDRDERPRRKRSTGGGRTPGPAPAARRPAHRWPRLLRQGREDLPAVDAHHAHPRLPRTRALPPTTRDLRRALRVRAATRPP